MDIEKIKDLTINSIYKSKFNNSGNYTPLIKKIEELKEKKIKDLTCEDIRVLVSQNIALDITIPIAISFIQYDVMIECDYYEGDLLNSMLLSDTRFWETNINLKSKLKEIIASNISYISEFDVSNSIKEELLQNISSFNKI